MSSRIEAYVARLRAVRVLDPACGCGNFLYVALRALKDLEHEHPVGVGLRDPDRRPESARSASASRSTRTPPSSRAW